MTLRRKEDGCQCKFGGYGGDMPGGVRCLSFCVMMGLALPEANHEHPLLRRQPGYPAAVDQRRVGGPDLPGSAVQLECEL